MVKFNEYPHVFSPLAVGNMIIKNRIQYSPMVSAHATALAGDFTEGLLEFVGAQARTGAAIVTIGASPVDYDRARDFVGSVSVVKDTDIPGLKLLADEAHRYGAKLSIELTHAGRVAHPEFLGGKPAFVPSVVPGFDPVDRPVKEISRDEIREVIGHYVDCTRRCMDAGLDMVMIHGAHGNLPSAFLSPVFNRRTDEYGGSFENRMRFPLEILEAVRNAVGNRICIEYRICGHEYIEGSPTVEEVGAFLKSAQKYIDMVIISGGLIISPNLAKYTIPTYHLPHMINVPYAAVIKKGLSIPVSVVGNITTMDEAEELLRSGKVDIVAMARNLIADGDFVTKAYRGKSDDIRPCLRCANCTMGPIVGAQLRCAVNPRAGRELKYRYIPKADVKKKVMVVGGGPAGMIAAQTAILRGHDVVLYERENRLGGRLYEAGAMASKDGFRRYIDWDIRETMRSGARIVLNTVVTPETIEAERPDAVVIAVGAGYIKPPIPGIDLNHVVDVGAADLGTVEIGENVVVCGGGLSGSECAIELARSGKTVTIVDMKSSDDLCMETNNLIRAAVFDLIEELGISTYYEAKVTRIDGKTVEITDRHGVSETLDADTVVIALGLEPDSARIRGLFEVVPETYVVGDSFRVGDIGSANMTAFNVAVEI